MPIQYSLPFDDGRVKKTDSVQFGSAVVHVQRSVEGF